MCLGRCKATPPQVLQPFQGYFSSGRPVLKLKLSSTVRDQISGVEVNPREQCLVPHPSRPTFLQSGMSCPCQGTSKVRSQHTLSATVYLNTGLNDNSYLTPSSCLINLAVSVLKVCSMETPYTGSHFTEQKSCYSPQNAHPKCQGAHNDFFLCFYP